MQLLQTRKFDTFFSEVQNYVHLANTFLDRGLMEILERNLDYHSMAFTHYNDGRFVSAMSYVTDVPQAQIMALIREYYRVGYFRNDALANYVTTLLTSLPSYNDCGPIHAKSVLSPEQFEQYKNFFAPYEMQDAVVLTLDQSSRLTIFHKRNLAPFSEEDFFTFGYVQKILQMSYAYWKDSTRQKQLAYIKDKVINDCNVGIAIFDSDMKMVECNSIFLRNLADIYHTSDLQKCVNNILVAVARGDTKINRFLIRFENSKLGNNAEKQRSYSCLRLEESAQELPEFRVSTGKKSNSPALNRITLLTNREVEVMTRYCAGKTANQISEELYISEWTVKAHIKSIYKKLNVTNQRQLISEYAQTRIIF